MKFKVGDKVKILGEIGTLVGINDVSYNGHHWKYIMKLETNKKIGWAYKNYKHCYGTNYNKHIKLLNKPKVYAWDTSAKKEQKKLEEEQEEVLYVQYFIKQLPYYRIGRMSGKSMMQWSLIELLLKYNVVLENK